MTYIQRVDRRTVEFGCVIIVAGLLAGIAGLWTTLVLRAVEHLIYHYSFGTLLSGVTESSPVSRALWSDGRRRARWFRLVAAASPDRDPAARRHIASHLRIPRLRLSIDAGLPVLLVGSGASLGREGGPRQFAAAPVDLGPRDSGTPFRELGKGSGQRTLTGGPAEGGRDDAR